MTIFEDFIEYCKEDNKQLAEDIETWLADYFDLPNRTSNLYPDERKWIKDNLSEENQEKILGYTLEDFSSLSEKDELTKLMKEKLEQMEKKKNA